jgi:predicted alpha/beta hydrolase
LNAAPVSTSKDRSIFAARRAIAVRSNDGHCAELIVHDAGQSDRGLLWIPAMGVPARKYNAFATAMAQQRVVVALHEFRGTATSTWRASRHSDWGYVQLLADIAASNAALVAEYPKITWTIGGHSLGAQLAGLSLALDPNAYAGWAIVGSGLPWWRSFPLAQQPIILGVFVWFRLLCAICGYFPGDRVGFAGREARQVIRDWSRSGLSGRYRPDNPPTDLDAALAAVSHRVLGLHLQQDRYVPARSLNDLLAKLPSAQITRAELLTNEFAGGRADHFGWMKDPEPVVKQIAQWMK